MKVHIFLKAEEVDEEIELENGISEEEIEQEVQEYVNGFLDWHWEIKNENC